MTPGISDFTNILVGEGYEVAMAFELAQTIQDMHIRYTGGTLVTYRKLL
jgi:hypothetical protein